MKIKCRQVLKELANYMEDDTSPELGVRTERHFQECNGCFATYDGMRKIVRLMGKAGIIGSAQELVETRILGGFLKNDKFGLGDGHALGLEQ